MSKNSRFIVSFLVLGVGGAVVGVSLSRHRRGAGERVSLHKERMGSGQEAEREQRSASNAPVAPPRFLSAEAPKVVTDPADPHYDPVLLARLINAGELFKQEPRDPHWAPLVEQKVAETVNADIQAIGANVKDLRVECHTTTCRFQWEGDRSERMKMMDFLTAIWGGTAGHLGNGNELMVVYAGGSLSRVKGDAPALMAALQEKRKSRLATISEQETRGVKAYPHVQNWPKQ